MIDAFTALTFSLASNPAVYALLLGSGVSRSAEIPTGWEIIEDLARRLAAAEGEDPTDPIAWYRERFGDEPDYSTIVGALATTPAERRAILHGYIEPTPDEAERGLKTPTAAHKAVARLVRDGVVRVIVTTNFDRLMENALREEGVEPTVVSSEDGVLGMAPLIHTRCLVVKVHGDYLDTRILNTDGELAEYGPAMSGLLDRIIDEHGLVICGWSGEWDPGLRSAILRAPNRRYPLFWASRREPAGLARDLLEARGGRWVEIESADDFAERVQRSVQTQKEMARPHPVSVDIIAATAKRNLSASRPRVQLGDLLQTEARRAWARIEAAEVLGQRMIAESEEAEFHRRVDVFEAAIEPLVRVFEILGRWGDGDEAQQVRDLLIAFHRPANQSGRVLWNELSGYPAVLLWYAYGIGAAKAGRLGTVYEWLGLPFRNSSRDGDVPAVRKLFLWNFAGAGGGAWALRLEAPARFPYGEVLRAWLKTVLQPEFVSGQEFDGALERFEMLATLRHLEDSTPKEQLSSPIVQGRPSIPAPYGRVTKASFREDPPLIVELKRAEESRRLVDAGFFGGDTEWLAHALKRIGLTLSDPFAD